MKNQNDFLVGYQALMDEDDRSLVEDFHESTKMFPSGNKEFIKRIGVFLNLLSVRHMITRAWKTYKGFQTISLPQPDLGEMSLAAALKGRRSINNIPGGLSGSALSIQQLATILGASYGITAVRSNDPVYPDQPFRAVTSSGALYPCEIYACVINVDGCAPGLYHYSVPDHQLVLLKEGNLKDELFECMPGAELWEKCSVMLVIGLFIERTLSKYMERGYRFAMQDSGALLQNLYLTTTAVGAIGSAVGGFYDQRMGNWLRMDNVNEFPAVCFAIGKSE